MQKIFVIRSIYITIYTKINGGLNYRIVLPFKNKIYEFYKNFVTLFNILIVHI